MANATSKQGKIENVSGEGEVGQTNQNIEGVDSTSPLGEKGVNIQS